MQKIEGKYNYMQRIINELNQPSRESKNEKIKKKTDITLKIKALNHEEVEKEVLKETVERIFNLLPYQTREVWYSAVGYDDTPVFFDITFNIPLWGRLSLEDFEER